MAITTAAIAGGVGMLGSSVIGAVQAGEERDLARQAMGEALAEIKKVGAPPDYAREIIYEKFKQAGILTPEVENQINLGVSKVAQIAENEQLKSAQLKALDQMQQRAKGGLTAEDRAALNQAKAEINQQNQAQQSQILQSMAQRGMGGAGAELALKLQSQQQGANLGAQAATQLGATASQRALEAARMSGEFAGGVQAQEFSRNVQRGQAEDAVNQFNIQNAMARQQRNVDRTGQANLYNVQRQQHVADLNVQQQNQELLRQREAERQRWLDSLSLAQAKSGAYAGAANFSSNQAQAIGSQWGQIAGGFGSIMGGALGAMPAGGGGAAAASSAPISTPTTSTGYWSSNPYR